MNRLPAEFFRIPPSPRTLWVELDELHVDERGTGLQRQGVPVAGVLPGVGGDLVGLADAAGGQHHRRRLPDHEPAGLPPVPEGAGDGAFLTRLPALSEQPGDRALHEHVDAEGDGALLQGADELQAGPVADVRQPRVAVPAEVALADQPVLGAVEQRAPVLQLADPVRCLLGVQLRHPPVVEHLPAAHGVPEVHPPVVLRVGVAHRRGDATLGHHRVCLAQQRLAHHRRPGAGLTGLDRGAQTGAAGPDDHHVVVVPFQVGHQKNLRSEIVSVASSST
jgi:hypothetical protein